jgi:hypothetical protein
MSNNNLENHSLRFFNQIMLCVCVLRRVNRNFFFEFHFIMNLFKEYLELKEKVSDNKAILLFFFAIKTISSFKS